MDISKKSIIAITGPSGVGKTTLGNLLSTRNNIVIPRHCTTRNRRNDDQEGFYRYLTHEEYRKLYENGHFLISSGDGPEVKKEYGNFYGVLTRDCYDAWKISDVVILFVSYKDINTLQTLKNEKKMEIDIVNLTFNNIEIGTRERLINDLTRKHTQADIDSRVRCAIADNEKYGAALRATATAIVYTDILNIEETYAKVLNDLNKRSK